jgi:hypothetical protein
MDSIGLPELLAVAAIVASLGSLIVLPYWKIFSKAGFPGALSLLMLIPLVNLVAMFYLAFAEWPIHRQLADARRSKPAM